MTGWFRPLGAACAPHRLQRGWSGGARSDARYECACNRWTSATSSRNVYSSELKGFDGCSLARLNLAASTFGATVRLHLRGDRSAAGDSPVAAAMGRQQPLDSLPGVASAHYPRLLSRHLQRLGPARYLDRVFRGNSLPRGQAALT